MKKILSRVISLTLLSLFLFLFTVGALASGSSSWHIKHGGTSGPTFPADARELSKYGCYYIDEKCKDEKRIYLTFDAGYENGNVARILDVLKKHKVPGAFFVLDNIILKNTELVLRMVDEGHLVCNHTKRHHDLSRASSEEIARDLRELEEIYEKTTGRQLSAYFRFPEGKYSIDSVRCVNELGYKTVFWSFAYADWDNAHQMSAERAINKVLSNTHNGAVMLFHPTSKTNADIFETLIIKWREMGYSFGTLDELTR